MIVLIIKKNVHTGVDYCAKGHNCHLNASCLNLETTYTCHCNTGYKGDGESCEGKVPFYIWEFFCVVILLDLFSF